MVRYACDKCEEIYSVETLAAYCSATPIREIFTPGTVLRVNPHTLPNWYNIIVGPTEKVTNVSHNRLYWVVDLSANKDLYTTRRPLVMDAISKVEEGKLEKMTNREFGQLRGRINEVIPEWLTGLKLHA
jgi:hypothetical protein